VYWCFVSGQDEAVGTTQTTFASAVYAPTTSTSSTRLAHAPPATPLRRIAAASRPCQQLLSCLCTCDVGRRVARRLRLLFYWPGSAIVSTFFADLYDVIDRLATFVGPLFIVGDLSVHLEQTNYASVSQLVDLLADLRPGVSCSRPNSRPTRPTRRRRIPRRFAAPVRRWYRRRPV